MKIVVIADKKVTAQQEALRLFDSRWTYQTFNKDWKRLNGEGYFVAKGFIQPICNCKEGDSCNFCN